MPQNYSKLLASWSFNFQTSYRSHTGLMSLSYPRCESRRDTVRPRQIGSRSKAPWNLPEASPESFWQSIRKNRTLGHIPFANDTLIHKYVHISAFPTFGTQNKTIPINFWFFLPIALLPENTQRPPDITTKTRLEATPRWFLCWPPSRLAVSWRYWGRRCRSEVWFPKRSLGTKVDGFFNLLEMGYLCRASTHTVKICQNCVEKY